MEGDKFPGTIPEETFESLAEEVPEIIRAESEKKHRGLAKYPTLNRRLAKLKKLNVLEWLIMAARIKGLPDTEIAKMIGCHPATVRRHGKKIASEDWVAETSQDLMALKPLFVESMRTLALKSDAYATVAFMKGMGVLTDKMEHTLKVDKGEQQKKFAERMEGTLGLKGDRFKPLEVPEKTDDNGGNKSSNPPEH